MIDKVKNRLKLFYMSVLARLLMEQGVECNESIADNISLLSNSLAEMTVTVSWSLAEKTRSDVIEVYRLTDVELVDNKYVYCYPVMRSAGMSWSPIAFKMSDNNTLETYRIDEKVGLGDILYIGDLWE